MTSSYFQLLMLIASIFIGRTEFLLLKKGEMNVTVSKMFSIEMKNTNNFEMIRTKVKALIVQTLYFLFQS